MNRRWFQQWPLGPFVLLALALLGCSRGSPSTSASTVCPGHIDPAPGPSLTVRTSDGAPTIASFRLDSRACQGYFALPPDGGVGAGPDGGYAEFRLYLSSGLFFESAVPEGAEPGPCLADVVSVYGTSVRLSATMYYHHRTTKHCYMNENCCDESRVEWLGSMSFSPDVQTVTFPPGPDASADSP